MKLVSVEEMNLACEMFLGVAALAPEISLLTLSGLVLDYVLENGHELYCVAPRGTVLARFLVQAFILAFQFHSEDYSSTTTSTGHSQLAEESQWKELCANENDVKIPGLKSEEPKAKVRKVEETGITQSVTNPEAVLSAFQYYSQTSLLRTPKIFIKSSQYYTLIGYISFCSSVRDRLIG